MRRIPVFLAAVLLAVSLPVSAAPAGAASPRVVTLGQRSVFTATETSSILVRLPKRQRFDLRSFRIGSRGNGRVSGFILVQQGVPKRRAATMSSLNIGRCDERACKARPTGFNFVASTSPRFPRGLYRLYVVADGAPVKVTVRAKDLSGRVAARASDPVASDLRTLTPRVDVDGTRSVYSAGDFSDLKDGSPGFAFMGLWVTADGPAAATAWGECIYYKDEWEDAPEERAFLPGCPEGDSTPSAFPAGEVASTYSMHGDSPHGIGAWYATTSPTVSNYGAVALWIDI